MMQLSKYVYTAPGCEVTISADKKTTWFKHADSIHMTLTVDEIKSMITLYEDTLKTMQSKKPVVDVKEVL